MAQATTRQASAVRRRHTAQAANPRRASKPGTPSSASHRDGANHRGGANDRGGTDDRGGALALPKPRMPKPNLSIWTRLVVRILKRIAKHERRRLAKATNWSLEPVDGEALKDKAGEVLPNLGLPRPQLPIQESVDVAVPLDFVWSRWMELRFLPEGLDRIVEIERHGRELRGQVDGESADAWSAEVLDERESESFAWKSSEGSDCAGLLTFHSLSERLTRLELTLDLLPRDARESALLVTHIAHRRARHELRRFKAELELVSPDVYASGESAASR